MLRILLADDHELTRSGVRYLLEKREGWAVCGEASNGRMAVEMAEKLRPDFAILDMSMPCLLYTSPSPRDYAASRMPSSA